MLAYYEARAPEYDDWYLRRGRYERGPIHDAAWNAELDIAGRWLDELPIAGRDRRARRRDGLVVAAPRGQGRAVAVRRQPGAARPGPRAARRPPAARPPPRPRRLGRAGSRGRRRLHRLLAEPRPARPARCVPRRSSGAGSSRAGPFAFIDSLPRPAVERRRPPDAGRRPVGPPPRRRPRVHDRQGLLRAGRARGGARARPVSATRRSRRPAGSS